MSNTRTVLVLMLSLMAFMMWNQWQQDYNQPTAPPPQVNGQTNTVSDVPGAAAANADIPTAPTTASNTVNNVETPVLAQMGGTGERIEITTDVLKVSIGTQGGTILQVQLPEYPVAINEPDVPFTLLEQEGNQWFLAQSGLVSDDSPAPNHIEVYSAQQASYSLDNGDELRVPLVWQQGDVRVTKWFIFKRGQYTVEVQHQVENLGAQDLHMAQYTQFQRTPQAGGGGNGFTNPKAYSYFGAAVYDPEEKFVKLPFDEFRDEPYDRLIQGGWLAMVQHYFVAAWIPPMEESLQYTTQEVTSNGPQRYRLRALSPAVQVPANSTHTFNDRLYVGPKIQDNLEGVAPGLRFTVDYGIMTIIAKPLFYALEVIHDIVRNWGVAIIVLTLLIKLAFFKLTEAQYRSMARMRKLQPRIEALKERYGDDRQKMSQAMMEMYRKEKVNPLGGCFPILIQIPVFISLYWVLLESVELRQAPFMLWIQDLSSKDPYFVLPILNGLAMIATQRMTPTPGMDPVQRRVMQSMPVIFSVLFAFFPAGLGLYWATTAISSLAQQWYITRRIEREG
ncbi:MAG: membrane protein insertase YidC [Xanthomonadales bacterium]|nr:membrane protein insertase YidC [Xanthomonadales bacterium]